MRHEYEFEVFETEGWHLALPYDMLGGTQGVDFDDAVSCAADWLRTELEYRLMEGEPFPEPTSGNTPRHPGGKTVRVAVDVSLEAIPRTTSEEAACALGIPLARIGELIERGLLVAFELDGDQCVSRYSVDARLEDPVSYA